MGKITVTGLGPGDFGLITLATWERMQAAECLLLRTAKHPTVGEIKKRGVEFSSYDDFYERGESFEQVYQAISRDIIGRAKAGQNIVYAVPGSPLVAERTVVLLREMAEAEDVMLEILPGMSFAEVLYVRLGVDPIEGVTITDAADLATLPPLPTGLIVTQVYNAQVASDTKLSLMENFPDEHEVMLLQNLGLPDEKIRAVRLYEIDRQEGIDHLTSLYVPPLPESANSEFSLEPLQDLLVKLRSPGGCPWDIVQTHKSLRSNLIEEAYEVVEAIDLADEELLCEELGDLLLQIVFHARMAEEAGSFSMQTVIDGVMDKLIRRHPHVFGEISLESAGAVVLQWDAIKRQEKKDRISLLDGIPKEFPALMRAQKMQHKAAKAGFDWKDIEPVWGKLREEAAELREAVEKQDPEAVEEELGDLLFSAVNLSRFLKVDAEVALQRTNQKFRSRFLQVEEAVKSSGKGWKAFSLEELDVFWEEAKRKK